MVQLGRHNVSFTWHAIALTMRSHIQWHTCVLAPVVLLFPFLPFPAVVDTAFLIRSASVYIDEFYLCPMKRNVISTIKYHLSFVYLLQQLPVLMRQLFRCKRSQLSKSFEIHCTDNFSFQI